MPETTGNKKTEPLAKRDPRQLEWAVRDLAAFEQAPWGGGNVVLPSSYVATLRHAAKLLVHAYETEELVPSQPLREALGIAEADNDGYLNRIEQLRGEHTNQVGELETEVLGVTEERNAFRTAYGHLEAAVSDTLTELSDIETFGTEDPLGSITKDLDSARDQTGSIVEPFID